MSCPTARLIVHADDLGLCDGVTRGIVRAHREGILTSASLLANAPGFDRGVRAALDNPALGVGVHLNLVRGRPVSPAERVPLLLDDGGFFAPRSHLWPACRRGTPLPPFRDEALRQAETEYRAQLARVRAAGIRPTHLDAERHHFRRTALYGLAAIMAREEGLALRILREPVAWAVRTLGCPGWGRVWRAGLLRVQAERLERAVRRLPDASPAPLRRPDWLVGQTHIGGMTEAVWLRLLASPPPGTTEVMTHPGEYHPGEMAALAREWGPSWIDPRRPRETAALTAETVKAAIGHSSRLRLVAFGAL